MLDLETFSTSPSAAIVQIGAVRFDLDNGPFGAYFTFERTIALQSSILAGGEVDAATIAWWRTQSIKAKAGISSYLDDPGTLASALDAFTTWFPMGAFLWSHGAAFDVPVLESAFRSLRMSIPWDYWQVRDTRTLFDLARTFAGWEKLASETAHTALADAVAQARDVRAAHVALTARIIKPAAVYERIGDVR